MAERNEALIQEYRELLRLYGVDHLLRRDLTAEAEAQLIRRIREGADRSAAVYGERNLLEDQLREVEARLSLGPRRDTYGEVSALIEVALADLGFGLPGPVYVGEYPHNSFNAQACRMRHGTLLLINTGLNMLLFEVALALNARVVIAGVTDNGDIHLQEQSPAMRERDAKARDTLARALATYVLHTDFSLENKQEVDLTSRGFLSFLIQRSGEIFAVAHEYGHLLAGHLDAPRGSSGNPEWLRKSHDQEFEADQIGALLALRVHARMDLSPTLAANLAAVGPSMFLGIDHLLNRVRAEVREATDDHIVSDHPPSHVRAAALRALLAETAGTDSFQMADSHVQALAQHEDQIIDQIRSLMRAR